MVQVTNFYEVEKKDGTTFVSLELSSGLELVQSSNTGKFYATVRRCRIPSTFNTTIAKGMIGQSIEGSIVKVESEPYEFTSPVTGETLQLQHTYAYMPKDSLELVGHTRISQAEMA
jgi:hypothetical protein